MNPRYSVYLPPCYRGNPHFYGDPIMRLAKHSRPAYCILDRETLKEGGNHYLPHHVCPVVVSDGHTYLEAMEICKKMNEEDEANKEYCVAI